MLYGVSEEDWRKRLGGYSGYLVFKFSNNQGSSVIQKVVHYHHATTGGKRSKGVLNVDINKGLYPNADLIVRGHIHQKWHVPVGDASWVNPNTYEMFFKRQDHLCTSTYKDGVQDGYEGFENEKLFTKSILGGWWADMERSAGKVKVKISEAY